MNGVEIDGSASAIQVFTNPHEVNILNNGANIKTVASLLGHRGLKHTEKYTRAVDELKQKVIDSLPELNM